MQLRRHTMVRLILEEGDKVLLLRQTHRNGGKFTLPGGKVEVRETPVQAVIREAFEEIGAVIREADLEFVHYCYQRKPQLINLILVFRTRQWQGALINREPHKFLQLAWFPRRFLPDRMTRATSHIVEQVKVGTLYSELTPHRVFIK